MTDLKRPLGLRFHLRSAAAACEGHGLFHQRNKEPHEAKIWNSLSDVLYEQAEADDHDTPLGRLLIDLADALLADPDDEPCGVTEVTAKGRRAVLDYRTIRQQQHPRPHTTGGPS